MLLIELLYIAGNSVSLLEVLKILWTADQTDLLELPRALVEKSGHLLTCTDAAADRRFGLLLVIGFGKRAAAARPFALLIIFPEKSPIALAPFRQDLLLLIICEADRILDRVDDHARRFLILFESVSVQQSLINKKYITLSKSYHHTNQPH